MSEWSPILADRFRRFDYAGDMLIAAFDKDDPSDIQVFRAHPGEHGALFVQGSMLSLNEQGWVPFAWKRDDPPSPDNVNFPPMWTDYLTEAME